MEKFKFSFVNNMSDFISANETELLSKLVVGTSVADYVSIFPGIKHAELVPTFDTGDIDSIASTGHCSTTFGDITMAEKQLTVCDYNIQKGYCPESLSKTLMGMRMNPGSYNEEIGAEEAFIEDMVAKAAVFNERKWFQATSASDCASGINEQLDNASASTVNVDYTAMTSSNALTVADTYILNLPDSLKYNPTVLFLNRADFAAYSIALKDANYFAYTVEGQTQQPMAIAHPASNTIVVSSEIGTGRALLTYGKNLALGTDLLTDAGSAEGYYSKDFKQYRIILQWRIGSVVFFPELCVRIA
jgi:hypothetical protein